MIQRKQLKKLRAQYGTPPARTYLSGDIERIERYFELRREREPARFYIDDTTCEDLSVESLFKRFNAAFCSSGEQYLYYLLRSPATERADWQRRRDLVGFFESSAETRLSVSAILNRLGRPREADPCAGFSGARGSAAMGVASAALALGVVFSFALLAVWQFAFVPALLLLLVNPLFHVAMSRNLEQDLPNVNYAAAMVFAARRVRRLKDPALDSQLKPMYDAVSNLRDVMRLGAVSSGSNNEIVAFFNNLLLLDLVCYSRLKQTLAKKSADVFAVHEHLGQLDAAISIASYRKSTVGWCEPSIDFERGGARFCAKGLWHPLLEQDAVVNDIETANSLLITGSNASGKSTFLKSCALAAIMAQSLCTAPCSSYVATSFHIYSSLAIADDLESGDSYFIAELRSLRRILDAAARGERILCVIDEVLRGTNTVERIAASSSLLPALARPGVLCIAATHDRELCGLVGADFLNLHFSERIENDEVLFDYKLKPGATNTRNAIKLLEIMDYPKDVVARAEQRAERYLETGLWS